MSTILDRRSIEERNKALVLEAFDTLFNKRDYAKAETFWSPHYIQHSAHIAPGREGLFSLIKSMPPTLKHESGEITASGDFVMLHGRFSGHAQPRNWIVVDIVRVQDGLLAEHWDVIEDEVSKENSVSGLPMYGHEFPALGASNVSAPTKFVETNGHRYAYRRFGKTGGLPLLLLQHFTGTLDNWDPAVTDPLALDREVILFDNAGVGRSSGEVPTTIAGMAEHASAFLSALKIKTCDVLGYSLGGMIAQQMVRESTTIFRRMILVGTAPRGGEDIMHLEKPSLAKYLSDPALQHGYAVLQKIFFAPSPSSQAAGQTFIDRLAQRTEDRDTPSGPAVAQAQMASFREWETFSGERFADLRGISQPTLVINGVLDEMIPVSNSYWLSANLPNAVLITYPDSGHGSLFQYHQAFTREVAAFLGSTSSEAPF